MAFATITAGGISCSSMTQLTSFRGRLADRLSGGMKQKLALACTLVHEPSLILLDEPTTGVDPISRREFWKLLSEFLAHGITILMSTPYLDEAERCSRVALLHQGRVLAMDEPARLRTLITGRMLEVIAPGRTGGRRPSRVAWGRRCAGLRRARARDAGQWRRQRGGGVQGGAGVHAARDVRPCGPCSRRSRTYSLPVWRARSRLMRSGVYLITAALTIGVVGSVAAQGPPTLRLTLEDALSKAVETSHRLAEARARESARRRVWPFESRPSARR